MRNNGRMGGPEGGKWPVKVVSTLAVGSRPSDIIMGFTPLRSI